MNSGCAVHYTDPDGKDNYFGFVSLSTETNRCIVTTTSKSVGLTIDMTKESGGVNIGYKTISKSYINDNEVIEVIDEGLSHKPSNNLKKDTIRVCKNSL